ncbi:MAG: hypothetical protein ACFFDN_13975 [Candidatus Hodarchaeota archaeon]
MKKLEFNPETHEYRWDGRTVSSVTQILNFIFPYFKRDNHAINLGMNVHKMTELIDRNEFDMSDPDNEFYMPYAEAWLKFKKEFKLTTEKVQIELPLYSERYGYAGTIDRFYYDKNIEIDIKTGQDNPVRYELQMLAYCGLIKENFGKMPEMYIVFLNPDGTYRAKKVVYDSIKMRNFICLKIAYEIHVKHKGG